MTYQALARKWRPQRFEDFVGQESTVRAITHMLEANRLHPAILFSGTQGVGKTTLARLIARSMNCEAGIQITPCGECNSCRSFQDGNAVDFIEIDAASRTRVEDTRELLENMIYPPHHCRFKIYLIDEVHMLSTHSFNALLKMLEEPLDHIKVIFATTDPQKIPSTVRSRCLHFILRKIPKPQIESRLSFILKEEGILFQEEAISLIAKKADGSLRDALTLLDQIISEGNGTVSTDNVARLLGIVSDTDIEILLDSLFKADMPRLLGLLEEWRGHVIQPETILNTLCEWVHEIHQVQIFGELVHLERQMKLTEYSRFISPQALQKFYQTILVGLRDLPAAPTPMLGFEMIILRLVAFLQELNQRRTTPLPEQTKSDTAHQPKPAPVKAPVSDTKAAPVAPVIKTAPPVEKKVTVPEPVTSPLERAPLLTNADWPHIVAALKLSGLHRVLAEQTTLAKMEDGLIVLQLPASKALMLNKAFEQAIVESLKLYFKKPVRLQVDIVTKEQVGTPAQIFEKERQNELEAQTKQVMEHPFIQETIAHFGEGIQVKVEPIETKS